MSKNTPTIGLEVHIEADTKTKMFCNCPNDFGERHPNINVCPICLGHPGTLPVINKEAINKVVIMGLALKGKIAEKTNFDRKSYFYPDLPKGFQISQYDKPLVENAELNGVKIKRIHLEEDTGRLVHSQNGKSSLVDYNRAGMPLIELVTEPDLTGADEVVNFAKELQLILRYLGISDADMEKGQMRVEVNISIDMGVKVELKNINSFKAVRGSIDYEIKRQQKFLQEGKELVQETRGWDDEKKVTYSQRSKESAHDYRYFPEPDLPSFVIKESVKERLRYELPELPKEKRSRFKEEFGLAEDVVNILVECKESADFFESATSEYRSFDEKGDINLLANYFLSDLRGLMKEKGAEFSDLKINPEEFAHLVFMVYKKELSSRLAKNMLLEMFQTGKDPETIKNEEGFELIEEGGELEKIADEVLKTNKKAVEDYQTGKETALKFLVGQIMAKTKGQANPEKASEVLKKKLGS